MAGIKAATLAVLIALIVPACADDDASTGSAAPSSPSSGTSSSAPPSSSTTPTPPSTPLPRFVRRSVAVASTPNEVVAAYGSIWVIGHRSGVLSRVDPTTGAIRATVETGHTQLVGLAAAAGHLWFLDSGGQTLVAVDVESGTVDLSVDVESEGGGLAATTDGVWFAGTNGWAVHVDRTGAVVGRVRFGGPDIPPPAARLDGNLLHVVDPLSGRMRSIDTARGRVVRTVDLGGETGTFERGPGRTVWVGAFSGPLRLVDPVSGKVRRTVPVRAVDHLARCGELLWNRVDATTVDGLDPATGARLKRYRGLPASEIPGGGITCFRGSLWVANWSDATVWEIPVS